MSGKRGVWFLLLVLACQSVFALIHDGWVLAGEDIVFDGVTFSTQINQRWDIVTVSFDSEVFPIGLVECEANPFYRVCYIDWRWNFLKGEGTYNASTEVKTPEIHITIETLTPSIKVTRSIDITQFLVNDIGTVSVVVNNEGEKRIFDLEYVDAVPPGFMVIDYKDAVVKGNTIKWNWPSLAGERSFWYKIRNLKPTNVSWDAHLSYIFEDNEYIKDIDVLAVTSARALNPLSVGISLSKDTTKIGESTTYTITLTNSETDRSIDIHELLIVFPEKVYVKGYGDLKKSDNQLSWSGTLNYQTSRDFKVIMRNDYSADNKINLSVNNSFYNDIEKRLHNVKIEYTDSFKSDFTKMTPAVKFMFDVTILDVGDDSNVRAFIENTDIKIPLFEVKYTVESDLFTDFSGTLEHVLPREKVEAFYFPFKTPSLEQDMTYEVKFKGRYRSVFYEYVNFEATNSIKIKKDPNFGVQIQEEEEQDASGEESNATNTSTEDVPSEATPEPEPVQSSDNIIVKFLKALGKFISDLF